MIDRKYFKLTNSNLNDYINDDINISKFNFIKRLNLDNISVIPREISKINSRDEVDTSIMLDLNYNQKVILDIPLILSPMEFYDENTIRFINERKEYVNIDNKIYHKIPVLPILHRFGKYENLYIRLITANKLKKENCIFGVAVSLKEFVSNSKDIIDIASNCDFILVDIANGYMEELYERIRMFKLQYSDIKIITGNITGYFNNMEYYLRYVDGIRIGISTSPVCDTYIQTGIGYSNTAVYDVRKYLIEKGLYNFNTMLIADGGLKQSKDIFLSLVLGADIVMSSYLFSFTELNQNNTIYKDNNVYKEIYGMASAKVNKKHYQEGNMKLIKIPLEEYYLTKLDNENTLFDWQLRRLKTGLKSALSYIGAKNIDEIKYKEFDILV